MVAEVKPDRGLTTALLQILDDSEVSLCNAVPAACLVKAHMLMGVFEINEKAERKTISALEQLLFEGLCVRVFWFWEPRAVTWCSEVWDERASSVIDDFGLKPPRNLSLITPLLVLSIATFAIPAPCNGHAQASPSSLRASPATLPTSSGTARSSGSIRATPLSVASQATPRAPTDATLCGKRSCAIPRRARPASAMTSSRGWPSRGARAS